ncbi:hypothetical protein L6452_00063 [Arctium lappa]|uniref:Uncharacterized protein n=1 Tax=Arctium lappa TaxID=4217 RepID=A0ACB9FD35_ARCLA|nr:hypothetical protein L6452_00063 [Arctium lappa]
MYAMEDGSHLVSFRVICLTSSCFFKYLHVCNGRWFHLVSFRVVCLTNNVFVYIHLEAVMYLRALVWFDVVSECFTIGQN